MLLKCGRTGYIGLRFPRSAKGYAADSAPLEAVPLHGCPHTVADCACDPQGQRY
jgi:hypothetical protein